MADIPIRNIFYLLCYAWDVPKLRELLALHEGKGHDGSGKPVELGDLMGLNVFLYHTARRKAAFEESFTLRGDTLNLMQACFEKRHRFIRDAGDKGLVFCAPIRSSRRRRCGS